MNAASPRSMLAEASLRGGKQAQFRRHGWTLARGFYTAAETTAIAGHVDQLAALPEVSGRQMVYREPSLLAYGVKVVQRIEDFCPHHAQLDALVRGGALQKAVEDLFGEPAVLFKDKINFKMSGGGGFEAHQDQAAGWSRYAPIFITAMITIDTTTLQNGCLEIATVPRIGNLIGAEWEPLRGATLDGCHLRPMPTAPGDVMFFDSYVPHASKPNLTADARRVLYVTYNRATDGDQRALYYAEKRAAFPPDIDRQNGVEYRFRV